jgi:hypothetical protein
VPGTIRAIFEIKDSMGTDCVVPMAMDLML